jgi:hypothetical protein
MQLLNILLYTVDTRMSVDIDCETNTQKAVHYNKEEGSWNLPSAAQLRDH